MENKQLSFEFEGAKYTLSFTRRTVQTLTRNGFKVEMVTEQPAIGIPMLYEGAFLANHRMLKQDIKDRIWDKITNKSDFIGKLMEMFIDPINVMLEDPEEDDEKKVGWEANF